MLFRFRGALRTMSETANAASLRQLVERRWRECTESRDVLLINSRLSAVPEEGIPVRFVAALDRHSSS